VVPAHRRTTRQRAYFPVARGLICAEHHAQVGSSVWVYLWLLCHQTDNMGTVGRGEIVTAAAIGADVEMDEQTVRRHLTRLENSGYLCVTIVDGKGLNIWINKPLVMVKEQPGTLVKVDQGTLVKVDKGTGRTLVKVDYPPCSTLTRVSIEGTEVEQNKKKAAVGGTSESEPTVAEVASWRAAVYRLVRCLPASVAELLLPGGPTSLDYALGITTHRMEFHHTSPEQFVDAVTAVLHATDYVPARLHALRDSGVFTRAVVAQLAEEA